MIPLRMAHVITTLNVGGAEMMLYKLLSRMDRDAVEPLVISLTDAGPLGERIAALGIPVKALGLRPGVPNPWAVARLARLLRGHGAKVVQTWLYHADLLGGLAGRWAGARVAWNLRQSNLDRAHNKRGTLLVVRACAALSTRVPSRIVCGSRAAQEVHAQRGYDARRMVVLPNGFDLREFCPQPAARVDLRAQLALPPDAPLIGLVGRHDSQKDHDTFFAAAGQVHRQRPQTRFVLCGTDITSDNPALVQAMQREGIENACHLLGRRDDMPHVMAALDLLCSSSVGEGFPNTLGEAMACGVPCVVTDVGDCAEIVGQTGRVVAPRDPTALAKELLALLTLPAQERNALGEAARERIREHYDLTDIAARYLALYRELAG